MPSGRIGDDTLPSKTRNICRTLVLVAAVCCGRQPGTPHGPAGLTGATCFFGRRRRVAPMSTKVCGRAAYDEMKLAAAKEKVVVGNPVAGVWLAIEDGAPKVL